METILRRTLRLAALTLSAALLAGTVSAAQVNVYLKTRAWTKSLPGGSAEMWAFASCTDNTFALCDSLSVPGKTIEVSAGDDLTIYVKNELPVPISLVIPGQRESVAPAPAFAGGRVRSFTHEVDASIGTGSYSWNALKAGSYLYQSGTQPSIQVPMGLYGALVVREPGALTSYSSAGRDYNAETLLLVSEIDLVQNAAVAAAVIGAPASPAYPSTINYNPKYFLVNGVAFDKAAPPAPLPAGSPGDTLLLRLLNAGLRPHVAAIIGLDVEVIAEDGNPYPTPRRHNAVLLPAGKTHDAFADLTGVGVGRTYAFYDRMLDLTNADAPEGGMIALLAVGSGSPTSDTLQQARDDNRTLAEDTPGGYVEAAPGVLGNDDPSLTVADSVIMSPSNGTVTLSPNGSFTYTPTADFAGQDAFVYLAKNAGGTLYSAATVRLTVTPVNDKPVARDDSLSNTFGAALDVAAPGVLANDGDPEGDALTAVLVGPSIPGLTLYANGRVRYTGLPRVRTFQYQARDAQGALSDPVTVALNRMPVRSLALNVVGPGGAVTDYRWIVEEDVTWHPDPGTANADSLATNFHKSYMPVVAQGCAPSSDTRCAGKAINQLALDPAKHYYVSVLPRDAGTDTGHTLGGAPVPPRSTNVTVYVNKQPIPTAQISVFVFEDNAPTNGAPDQAVEAGLGGFQVVIEDAGGRYGHSGGQMLTDAFGNLLKNAKAGTPECPGVSAPPGVILTCPDGTALIQNLPPGKYGVLTVPPANSTEGWLQTSTIEGSKVNDAWVKANEPPFFQEFGPPGYHVFAGFVSPKRLVKPAGGTNTVTGTVTNMHMSRPPDQRLWDAGTNDALSHTTAWVGLNSDAGIGANIAAVKAGDTGAFTIDNVPNGTYQLVVWDDYLDVIIAYRNVTVNNGSGGALGNVPVFNWFARLEHNVFLDKNENGWRDVDEQGLPTEPGLIEQNINLRFRDGSIYQSFPTDSVGFVPFDEVFPFFNWLVAEVDFARWKPTGVTVTVDAGGALPGDNKVLTPQDQTTGVCPDGQTCTTTTRIEPGPQLLQAFQGFLGQTSILDWGKAPYKPGENGGISGIVYYASTRAENNPRLAAADTWEPGIPRVKVRLYREVAASGGGTKLALVDEVQSDSWDDNPPEGCPGADPGDINLVSPITKCYDGLRNWNQIRPGVFDGGYAFSGIPPGTYTVEVVPPPGYELVKEEDKNVDFGDAYATAPVALMLPNLDLVLAMPDQAMVAEVQEPEPGLAQPVCVGNPHTVPAELTLFPGIEAPYAGFERPLCDRKQVVLNDQAQAAADFHLFTSAPIASHFTGMILDDLSQEFNKNSPQFGEKWAPPFVPVSIHDWTGREISRIYSDQWGRINGLVPSTFTANAPIPSGYSPNMVITCMNDPGPIPDPSTAGGLITDPYYDPSYSNFCYTFQYMPGTTTYLDTPVLPTAAFAAGDRPVDCAFQSGTPVIRQVNGNGLPGPFVNPTQGFSLEILSQGSTRVPNPLYDGPTGTQPKTITRDFGFGTQPPLPQLLTAVTLGNVPLIVTSWSSTRIQALIPFVPILNIPLVPKTGQLVVRRSNGRSTTTSVTVTVSSDLADQPIRVSAGQSISDAIAGAAAGSLVLVGPGSYNELVVMAKPVRLQGAGAGSTTINAVKRPPEKLTAWRDRIDALVASGAVDPLPGQEFAAGGLEPDTLGTEEGAGITVLAPNPASDTDPRWPNRFRPSAPDFTAARIDGFTVTGGDLGGGIFVNGWAHNLQISNNRITGNAGYYHGGLRVGRPFLEALAAQADPYGFNKDLRIHNNAITQNGGLAGAGGGVSLCTGSDGYQLFGNWVCGNFSEGDGGGIGHFGRSDNGQILRNTILFNQSYNQGLTKSGGGLYVAGQAPAAGGLSLGAGRNLLIDRNLVQGNQAGAGHGGGVRLERINGFDVASNPGVPAQWYGVRLTNNMIVNNVTGWSGGGVSMLDAARVEVVNNTIAHNDSTATVGGVFGGVPPTGSGDANISVKQPAGVSAEPHSGVLAALTSVDFSDPTLTNNIIWRNRAFHYDGNTDPAMLIPNLSQPTPGACDPAAFYWDLGVLDGVLYPTYQLHPRYSVLTALTGTPDGKIYTGNNNAAPASAGLVNPYCNGARSLRLLAEITSLQVAPALDEGGNWIDVRYGPISLTGNYHIVFGSAAKNTGTSVGAPTTDFDGDGRPIGPAVDKGADERP